MFLVFFYSLYSLFFIDLEALIRTRKGELLEDYKDAVRKYLLLLELHLHIWLRAFQYGFLHVGRLAVNYYGEDV